MLVFEGRENRSTRRKTSRSRQSRELTTSTQKWSRVWESNPGNNGGRRVLSPLRKPCLTNDDDDDNDHFLKILNHFQLYTSALVIGKTVHQIKSNNIKANQMFVCFY